MANKLSFVKEIPWHKALAKEGLNEKGFVKEHIYGIDSLTSIFNIIGENIPNELVDYIKSNKSAKDGSETEIQITNKHLSINAKNSGRADMLIEYTVKLDKHNSESHALWIETMDQSTDWNWEHHQQWWNKIKPLEAKYDNVIPIMIAGNFEENYINDFNKYNTVFDNKTHAIELKMFENFSMTMSLKTDSYENNKTSSSGEHNQSEIYRINFFEELSEAFKGSNIEIYGSHSERKNGYFRIRYNGKDAGMYLRPKVNGEVGIAAQGPDYKSKHVKEVYDMIKYSNKEVQKAIKECSNITLKYRDAKDPVLSSDKLLGVEGAKKLINSFVDCVLNPSLES